MKLNSLALRLFLSAAVWALLALPVAGFLLTSLFRAQAERDFDIRLANQLPLLISASVSETGSIAKPKSFGDELFQFPETGWYWQISPIKAAVGPTFVSESLTDSTLTVPYDQALAVPDQEFRFLRMSGPAGKPIRAIAQVFPPEDGAETNRHLFVVTGSLEEVDSVVSDFAAKVAVTFAVLGAGLIAAIFFQVVFGLKPLKKIERGLAQIRAGQAERLEGEMPVEIEPLQDEINKLISSNHDIVERARTHVGNLAHALKTPLAVVTNEARASSGDLAEKVAEQAGLMKTQIDLYLDRARMVARTGVISDVTPVEPILQSLARVLERIYEEKGISITVHCPTGMNFQGEKQDLEEMLGNLIDNACKWAKSSVVLDVREVASSEAGAAQLKIAVGDDGPGLTKAQRGVAKKRGLRLDEQTPGSGLGLSIVRDLVELYGGSFDLGRAEAGGLSAELTLPRAV